MGRNKSRKQEIPTKSKLKKDPGVPRLQDIRLKNAEKFAMKERAGQPVRTDPDSTMAAEPTLSSLAQLAESASTRADRSTALQEAEPESQEKTKEQLRRHYVRALHKVVDESDIIVLVLDARDPEGCRSRLVEEEVRRREHEGKRLVFVMNKIDLVPKENAQQWLRHLRHSAPTLPFRCPTNAQRSNLSSQTAPALLRLIKACRANPNHAVTVGVVGYPNVGKSSLINALKRAKVCAVASTPGHTKELQSVQLERGLRIVDSPGVIFDEGDDPSGKRSGSSLGILLRNVVRVEDINDPIAVAEQIVGLIEPQELLRIYSLIEWSSPTEFLTMLALSSGRIGPGGIPDLLAAARTLISDWNAHKIVYYTEPPTIHPSAIPSRGPGIEGIAPGAENVGEARIVEGGMSAPFVLDGLFGDADAGAFVDADMANDANDDETSVNPVPEASMELPPDDGTAMEADDGTTPIVPSKRERSISPTPSVSLSQTFETNGAPRPVAPFPLANDRGERMPKRLRRNKGVDVEAHARVAMASARKNQKMDRKKARKAARNVHDVRVGGGMDIDEGLE